ncbi:MAG: neutral/alkaline non-lysosomal ceramidase N-terminal domain-containing protein [Gammaproteobacteria bacterium]|nr:neutral/alkaline non-lysosomal ceramidase N-terminal domain-containing protein [Gammaproteobacteria bacterium]
MNLNPHRRHLLVRLVASGLLLGVLPLRAATTAGVFRAGAARVDITPAPEAALPMSGYSGRIDGFKGIRDRLHVRAIVVDDGTTQAAIVGIELVGMSHAHWERMTARISRDTGIPVENILLCSVHTHAAPAIGTYNERAPPDVAARREAYVQKLEDSLVAVVQQAKAAVQPARIGYGTGQARVNMNRRARNGEGGWMLGHNPDGVSDKTVAVVRLDNLAGEPFAIFSNYGVHATVLGTQNYQISPDLPGATARHVEQHFGGKVVSPWTSGAAGDQDPIYRVGTDFRNVSALGQILGEEVVRVAEGIKTVARGRVQVAQTIVTCPGKRTVQMPARGKEYQFADADPVPIRLSLLVVGDIAFAGVSAEVLTNIGLRLKRESPLTRTMMVTHCNGSSGYIPDDAAYDQVSYEITATRVKRGCAEAAIVDGFVGLLARLF